MNKEFYKKHQLISQSRTAAAKKVAMWRLFCVTEDVVSSQPARQGIR
ncbi:hypothetical protein [Paenibacillus pabuli]|nr:hypothetical protein [Paenibacillus pabuli]MEC0128646.1 hypothetical protein [Paenibacillus pabuli]